MTTEEITEVEPDFFSYLFADLYWTDFVGLASAFLLLCVLFNLAFNSSKLHKRFSRPGTNILRWSCWVLATAWVPLTAVTYFMEDYDLFFVLSTVISTGAMITAALGFRKLVRHLTS